MTVTPRDLRAANRVPQSRRSGRGWLLAPLSAAIFVACVPFGGMAALITTIPTLLVLLVLYVRLVAWAARTEPDPGVGRTLRIGFAVKLVGFCVRYLVIAKVYGAGDARSYHQAGAILARSYRTGTFHVPVPGGGGEGTAAIKIITGFFYSVTGSSLLIGALAFSLLSFTGVLLLVKAFRIGVPQGDHLRYARLILFLPSMWFWPSSLGKEAWMVFGLGLIAYGTALACTRAPGGLVLFAAGTASCAYVRPHIALVAAGAAVVAVALRSHRQGRRFNRIGKVLILVPLVFGGLLLLSKSQQFLRVDSLSLDAVQAVGEKAGKQSDQGGSAFVPAPVHGIQQLPAAVMTVLFRPFPSEAHSGLSLVISLEGTFLIVLTLLSWRRLLKGVRALRRTSYLVLCLVATLAFVVAFSNFANFGILARERVQVLPFSLAFLAAASSRRRPAATPPSNAEVATDDPPPLHPRITRRWKDFDAEATAAGATPAAPGYGATSTSAPPPPRTNRRSSASSPRR